MSINDLSALTGANAAPPQPPSASAQLSGPLVPDPRDEIARDLARLAQVLPVLAERAVLATEALTTNAVWSAVKHLRCATFEVDRAAKRLKVELPSESLLPTFRHAQQTTTTQEQR